jgi:hypothetical protein
MGILKTKAKVESPKPVNLDFTIPDYRQDKRYIGAQTKLAELQARARQLEQTIDKVKLEIKVDSTSEMAAKLLRGESAELSQDKRLETAHAELRIVKRAAELQQVDIDNLRIRICGESGKDPVLAENVAAVFRRTGQAMSALFAALKDEDKLLFAITAAGLATRYGGGLSSGRAEWTSHPIFESLKRGGLDYNANPLRQYLLWSKQHFGA